MSFTVLMIVYYAVFYSVCYASESDVENSRIDPSYMLAETGSSAAQIFNYSREFDLDNVRIEFPAVVKGEDYKVESLGYKDGAFMFGYLGDLVSLFRTDKFPLETLREVLSRSGKKGPWDLVKECLENEPGLIALATTAIVLSVLIPLLFTSVCCCRIGGKCGGKKSKDKAKCLTCARTTWELLLAIFLIISCVGTTLAFVTNMQMRTAVQDAEAVVSAGVADAGAFVRNTALQLRVTTESAADVTLEHVFRDLDGIRTILGRPIQKELATETKFEVATKELLDLHSDVSRIVSDLGVLLASAQNARLQAAGADSALGDLMRQIDNVVRRCGEIDKRHCSAINLNGLRVSVSFSTYALEELVSALRRMVQYEEISGLGRNMQKEYSDIPSYIQRTTADMRSNIKSMLRQYRTELVESTREFDTLFADIQSRMFQFGTHGGAIFAEARRYDDVRFFVGLGVSTCLLFVWLSLFVSICCGCSKGSKPTEEGGTCRSKFGGGCLFMSVFFIAILSCPLWLAVSGLLIIGSHGQGLVCQTLYEDDLATLGRIVDGPSNDFGPGGFVGSLVFRNDSFKVPIQNVLRKCQQRKSSFEVFHLNHFVNLEALSRIRERTGVEKELEDFRLDLSGAISFSPEVEVSLKNNVSALQIELTTFRIELQRQVLPSNPAQLVDQLEVAAREVKSQSTSSQLSALAARARDIVNNQVRQLEIKKEDLQETPTRLIAESSLIMKAGNNTFGQLRKIQYFLKNHAASVFNHKVRAYSRRIVNYLVQFTAYMNRALQDEIANCEPIWNVFNQARIVLCRYIVDPLNGFWFSTSCCLLVYFLASFVAIKLAKYYRNDFSVGGGDNGFSRPSWNIVEHELHESNW